MSSPYREYAPHPALAPYVQCYWSIVPSPYLLTNRILPDGCLDILVSVSASACEIKIIGTMQSAQVHSVNHFQTYVGVRFKPGGAFPFLRLPLHELTDRELDIHDLWNIPCLPEQVYEADSPAARIARLEAILLRRIPQTLDPLLSNALHRIRTSRGMVSVKELVSTVALSERQLERRFRDQTGLTPKAFARLTRFRTAAMTLQQSPLQPLDDLAQNGGYYDQAHFIHDFKAFAGLTPTEFLAERQDVGFLQYLLRLP
jgi:AraC-like DNA-binding protein